MAGAARQRADLLVHHVGDPDEVEHAAHLVATRGPVGHLLQHGDVVDEVERREALVETGLLGR